MTVHCATAPFWISLYMRKILFSLLSVRRRLAGLPTVALLARAAYANAHTHKYNSLFRSLDANNRIRT
jgi:hypothetical protein